MDAKKQAALIALIKLVADAAKDTAAALQPGQSILAELANYENLISDITAFAGQIGDLKAEVAALKPEDYVALAAALVADLALSNEKAQSIVASTLDLAAELAGPVLTKVEAVVAAAKA